MSYQLQCLIVRMNKSVSKVKKTLQTSFRLRKKLIICSMLSLFLLAASCVSDGSVDASNPDRNVPQISGGAETESGNISLDEFTEFPEEIRINASDLKNMIDSGNEFAIIDIRPFLDYMSESVPGSISVPFAQMDSRMYQIPREKLIVLISDTTQEGSEAFSKLITQGYDPSNILILDDGLRTWIEMGFETLEAIVPEC